jgi:hypothetical protein
MHNFIAGGLSYSIAWNNGNNSAARRQDQKTSLREFPLDWDIRHQFNANATFRVARGEEFMIPFTNWALPFSDFSVSINYTFSSGRPFTPVRMGGDELLETNSRRMPATQYANLRFIKNFRTGRTSFVRAFLTIENLFKHNNINTVHPRTGWASSPDGSPVDGADLRDWTHGGWVFPEHLHMHNLANTNPAWQNNNRNFIVGISYNF